jgi:hypothetical protein
MARLPGRTKLSRWAGVAALTVAFPWALPAPATGLCPRSQRAPQRFEATIEACRNPEGEIRTALEPHRKSHEAWVATLPDWMRANKSFEQTIRRRLAWPEVIVTLRVKDYSQFSADPKRWEKIRAGMQGEKAAPPEPREYLLRLKSGDCDSIPVHHTRAFIEDFTCCDVRPSTDNACLLELPAVQLLVQK